MEIEALRPLLLRGIHEVEGKQTKSFKHWISSGNYIINSIDGSGSFSFYINDIEPMARSLAFDCSIFASAAIESAQGITKNEKFPKSLGWVVIRAYYSAFFAAHSIMRAFGCACVQLEKGHIKDITDYSNIYGFSGIKLEQGFYKSSYDEKTKILRFIKLCESHSDTWSSFNILTKNISEKLLETKIQTKNTKTLFTFFNGLEEGITNKGKNQKGNWLSSFRNNVNYKLEYCTWYPYSKQQIDYSEVEHILNSWNADKIECGLSFHEKNDIKRFFIICSSIVRLCKLLIIDLDKMCSSKKSVHSFLPIAYLNHMAK